MNAPTSDAPHWSTSSFGDSADTSDHELSALRLHLARCRDGRGRLFALQCAVEMLHGLVAGRFVTTLLAGLALLIGTASLL